MAVRRLVAPTAAMRLRARAAPGGADGGWSEDAAAFVGRGEAT